MNSVKYEQIAPVEFGVRDDSGSTGIKTLIQGTAADPDNFAVYLQELDHTFYTPRHRHNFDQFRIALERPYNIAPKTDLHPGEMAYFPEGAHYGPQNGEPGTVVLSLHVTGPSRTRYVNLDDLTRGLEELKKRGTITNGVFTEVMSDGRKRNQDSYEAIWEQLECKKLVYPNPLYTAPILMRPEKFSWTDVGQGVREKHLGTFTENKTGLRIVEIASGASAQVGESNQRCVFIVLTGSIAGADGSYGRYSSFLTASEERALLKAESNGATLVEFVLPAFRSEQ